MHNFKYPRVIIQRPYYSKKKKNEKMKRKVALEPDRTEFKTWQCIPFFLTLRILTV